MQVGTNTGVYTQHIPARSIYRVPGHHLTVGTTSDVSAPVGYIDMDAGREFRLTRNNYSNPFVRFTIYDQISYINIIPGTTTTYNLGSASFRWLNTHTQALQLNGVDLNTRITALEARVTALEPP